MHFFTQFFYIFKKSEEKQLSFANREHYVDDHGKYFQSINYSEGMPYPFFISCYLLNTHKRHDDINFCLDVDNVEDSVEAQESVDQVAVLTSNALFFIVMFIFAIFETYVFEGFKESIESLLFSFFFFLYHDLSNCTFSVLVPH